jgi:hypothetical protein
MSKGDLIVERGAQRLQHLAGRAAARGDGFGEWLSEELVQDAEFLRKLKPSLIAARARGSSTASSNPTSATASSEAAASAPPPQAKPKKPKKRRGGPSPLVFVGAAFAIGIVAAKVLDWRGHAHPRD